MGAIYRRVSLNNAIHMIAIFIALLKPIYTNILKANLIGNVQSKSILKTYSQDNKKLEECFC